MPSQAAFDRLSAAAIDGRTETIRYRQTQLQSLHGVLTNAAAAASACRALAQGSSTPAEAEAEYALAMDAVRHAYDGLDADAELQAEYSVVRGQGNEARRVGVGMVVVRPTKHARFYSVLAPLAAAVAAGNCVVLELGNELPVDGILREALTKALDQNTFYVSDGVVTDSSILDSAVLVDQTGDGSVSTLTRHLISSSSTRTVAVVDRTANVEAAAKAITRARFGFGGTSPYAPDLVLVNEFVKKPFLEACSRYATAAFASDSEGRWARGRADNEEEIQRLVNEGEEKKEVTSFGSRGFKLIDVLDKNTPLIKQKITGCYLPIATTYSLVDAAFTQEFENPLLAGYFFANSTSAKYLSQHLPCHISCINHIPAQLLVGPAAPIAHDPDFLYRYNRDMFSVSRPQFVATRSLPKDALQTVEALLDAESASASTSRFGKRSPTVTAQKVRALATRPLRPTGQVKSMHKTDFFLSGLLIGGGAMLGIIVPVLGWSTWVLGRGLVGYAARLKRS
ncbi:Aldehyde/histidinol dehydrogenase [Lasiosphaeria hispida]|uniref:Aldehyde/histidinol dehydrogenase n=1 Tax=Lasiosphaeria hispida TaxID=260671 RepID=A0AAJ0HR59_9PEZI|nr:Aldehyde/histidinol dehydrogenase [Lasiosphaeria hispida]